MKKKEIDIIIEDMEQHINSKTLVKDKKHNKSLRDFDDGYNEATGFWLRRLKELRGLMDYEVN